MKACLLLFLSVSASAQTMTIQTVMAEQEPKNSLRAVLVQLLIVNHSDSPLLLDNDSFYLSNYDNNKFFPSQPRVDGTTHSREIHLAPKGKSTERLSFLIGAAVEITPLKLCYHTPASDNWSDYIEIPFGSRAAATAPMWHPARIGKPEDDKTYKKVKDDGLKPPRLLKAVDPRFPPGGQQILGARVERVSVVVSSIVDREGKPQQVQVVAAVGSGFDEEAVNAAQKFRYMPATDINGAPIPVQVKVEMQFRSH